MEEFILKLIEVVGINAVPFVFMAYLYIRQQNIQKARDSAQAAIEEKRIEMERESRKSETLQQNNILNMYNRFDGTLAMLDNTLRTAFTTTHEDNAKTVATLEAQTAKLVDLETAMSEHTSAITQHTQQKPTIEDLMKAIEELGKKIDSVDHTVTEIRREFDNVKQQAVAVEKTVTQENEVVEVKPEVQTPTKITGGETKPENDDNSLSKHN